MTTSHMSTATDTTHAVLSQDGAKISYLTMGSGPAVLVIPGALSMAADYLHSKASDARAISTMPRQSRATPGQPAQIRASPGRTAPKLPPK